MRQALVIAALLLTAACGGRDTDSETAGKTEARAPVQAKGEEPGTSFRATADSKTGAVDVALPGARLSLDLPQGLIKTDNFEIDGTKLYPGSTIDRMDVHALDRGEDKDDAKVRVDFTAPAEPAVVKAWFLSSTAKKDRPLREAGESLVGATEDGNAYRITLSAAPGGKTAGVVMVDAKDKG